MTYRQTSPLRNILPVAILLPVAIAVGCAGPATIRFEPAKGDHSDLAVGEKVVERLALVADAPTDWDALVIATSCDCMTARFLDRSDPKRAWVEVEFEGDRVEDIDGSVTVQDAQRRDVAAYEARVVLKRKPFVQPRQVALEAGGGARFEIVVGQAFARGEKRPDFLLDDVKIGDDSKVVLVEAPPDDTEQLADGDTVVVRSRLAFEPNEAARAKKDSVKITLRFGAPVVERVVEVSWPGSH